MSANQANLEAPAAETPISRKLEAIAKNFGQHQHDTNDSFTVVHDTLKSLSTADRQAIFNKMSPDQKEKPKDLPDLKLTGHHPCKTSDGPDARSGATDKHDSKPDATRTQSPTRRPMISMTPSTADQNIRKGECIMTDTKLKGWSRRFQVQLITRCVNTMKRIPGK